MDTASPTLEALLELLAMLLLLSQVSMGDMLELADILQTLVELFMLPSARLRLMLDTSMEDMVDMVWDMLVLATDMVLDMAGVSSMVKQNLLRYFQAKLLFSTNSTLLNLNFDDFQSHSDFDIENRRCLLPRQFCHTP